MFVCLGFGHFILFVYFFPWPQSSEGPRMGVNSLKTSIFLLPTPLRGYRSLLEIFFCRIKTSIFPLYTPLRECRSLLEIVFCRTV